MAKKKSIKNRIVDYRLVKGSELVANPNNWRKHPTRQREALRTIVEQIGFAGAELVRVLDDGRLMLIDGHLRADEFGDEELPVLVTDLSEKEADAILATFDPIGAMAEADNQKMVALIDEVNQSFDLGGLMDDIAEAFQVALDKPTGEAIDTSEQINKADELQAVWNVQRGQIWRVGKHRIMCGDSTDTGDVARLMDGAVLDATVTDPPYMTTDLDFDKDGISYDFWKLAQSHSHRNAYFAMFAPVEMLSACADEWSLRFTGCWVKPAGGMRTHSAKKPMCQSETYAVFAHPKHKISDLIWNDVYFEGEPYRKVQKNTGYKRDGKDQLDRSNTSTWTRDNYVSVNDGHREYTDTLMGANKPYMKHDERTIHPTQKPIDVISVIIRWLTNEGQSVYEPFLGSGTTAVACEQTGRVCYGMEIHPPYVAVTLERLKQMGCEVNLEGE